MLKFLTLRNEEVQHCVMREKMVWLNTKTMPQWEAKGECFLFSKLNYTFLKIGCLFYISEFLHCIA